MPAVVKRTVGGIMTLDCFALCARCKGSGEIVFLFLGLVAEAVVGASFAQIREARGFHMALTFAACLAFFQVLCDGDAKLGGIVPLRSKRRRATCWPSRSLYKAAYPLPCWACAVLSECNWALKVLVGPSFPLISPVPSHVCDGSRTIHAQRVSDIVLRVALSVLARL